MNSWDFERHDCFLGTTAGVRCGVWYLGMGAAVVPVASGCASRVLASVVVIDATKESARLYRERLPVVDMTVEVGPIPKFNLNSSS